MISLFLVYFLVTNLITNNCRLIENNLHSVCSSNECSRIAEYFRRRMDENVSPCDDFYNFACGNFEKYGLIGSNTFIETTRTTMRQISHILSEKFEKTDNIPLQKAKQFYSTCLNNSDNFNRDPFFLIYELMVREFGTWPVGNDILSDKKLELNRLMKIARKLGFDSNSILAVQVLPNTEDTRQRILVVTPPTQLLRFDNIDTIFKTTLSGYSDLIMAVAIRFLQYSNRNITSYQQLQVFARIVEVIHFETKLAEAIPKPLKHIFESFNPTTIEEIQREYPFINWLEFLQISLGPEVQLSKSDHCVITSPEYVKNINPVIDSSEKRVMTNYVIWKYIFYALKLSLILSFEDRWMSCLAMTAFGFDSVISYKYIQNYFPNKSKAMVEDMASEVIQSMRQSYQTYTWIDERTRQNIFDKIDNMVIRIAYTDDMFNGSARYRDLYATISINSSNFFTSALSVSKFYLDFIASKLREPIDRNEWPYYVSTMMVNAFYIPVDNSVTIPAAMLQKEFFSVDRPYYLNYGSIGFIIGHESSHAFDNTGRFFDKFGIRVNNIWGLDSKKVYERKLHCYINQYNKYQLEPFGIYIILLVVGLIPIGYVSMIERHVPYNGPDHHYPELDEHEEHKPHPYHHYTPPPSPIHHKPPPPPIHHPPFHHDNHQPPHHEHHYVHEPFPHPPPPPQQPPHHPPPHHPPPHNYEPEHKPFHHLPSSPPPKPHHSHEHYEPPKHGKPPVLPTPIGGGFGGSSGGAGQGLASSSNGESSQSGSEIDKGSNLDGESSLGSSNSNVGGSQGNSGRGEGSEGIGLASGSGLSQAVFGQEGGSEQGSLSQGNVGGFGSVGQTQGSASDTESETSGVKGFARRNP